MFGTQILPNKCLLLIFIKFPLKATGFNHSKIENTLLSDLLHFYDIA